MKYVSCGSIVVLLLGILLPGCCEAWVAVPSRSIPGNRSNSQQRRLSPNNRSDQIRGNMIGTGFSFEDGEQILVSVQKPFGIVLEQGGGSGGDSDTDSDENAAAANGDEIVVTDVDPSGSAGRAGVRKGDVLVAVQNASTVSADLAEVLEFIANKCPRVVNLRFQRRK